MMSEGVFWVKIQIQVPIDKAKGQDKEIRPSVMNAPGKLAWRSCTAAVSMTISPGLWKLLRINFLGVADHLAQSGREIN